MRRRDRTTTLALLLPAALLAAGCGASEPASPAGDAAAGACLVGATECADFPTGTGGVTSQPDGSVLVADVVSTTIDGPFLISGYWLADADGVRLCAGLLESSPPQCGLPSMPVQATAEQAPDGLDEAAGVTWSSAPVVLEGQVVDGTFVVGAP